MAKRDKVVANGFFEKTMRHNANPEEATMDKKQGKQISH